MTIRELAEQLNGIEYPCRIPKHLVEQAKEHGWVIVYGASDDLIEFEGAVSDEAGVYEGGKVRFDKEGILPSFADVEHEPEECRKWLDRFSKSIVIEAMWASEGEYSWTYRFDILHYTFEVMEDGMNYCRGLVFAI